MWSWAVGSNLIGFFIKFYLLTEVVSRIVLSPYVPYGKKNIGEGDINIRQGILFCTVTI